MYEVERKLRVGHEAVRPGLSSLGLEREGVILQRDTYFDHPARDFVATDEAVRVRVERSLEGERQTAHRLTYKGPRLDAEAKTRRELESEVATPSTIHDILEALSFEPAGTVEKRREYYRGEGLDVCLDEVDQLGEFVEIEAHDTGGEPEEAVARIDAVLADLDLEDAESIETSYLEMLL